MGLTSGKCKPITVARPCRSCTGFQTRNLECEIIGAVDHCQRNMPHAMCGYMWPLVCRLSHTATPYLLYEYYSATYSHVHDLIYAPCPLWPPRGVAHRNFQGPINEAAQAKGSEGREMVNEVVRRYTLTSVVRSCD